MAAALLKAEPSAVEAGRNAPQGKDVTQDVAHPATKERALMMFVVGIGRFLICIKFTVDTNSSGAAAAIFSSNRFFESSVSAAGTALSNVGACVRAV